MIRVSRRGIRGRCLAPLLVLLATTASPAVGSSRYDPGLRFRTITTPRFDIHFHQGEEAAARRLAVLAELVAASVDGTLGRASGRIQVVLVNQDDLANGWATPLPYNVIEISAAGPRGGSSIGNTDDWLRLVFTHEYTHIVHLERAGGWMNGLRRVFGRHPALFPNLTLPLWSIEGLATFQEGAGTARGRVQAGDFRQIVTRAAAARRFEPLHRTSGGLDDWPGGNAPYAYGALFHAYLADRYGVESLRRLTDETGRRLPYLGPRAFRKVFGAPLGRLWSDFEADMRDRAPAAADRSTRITAHGFTVAGPRFDTEGGLYYSTVNPDGFPALMVLERGASAPRRVTHRYLGERVGFAGPLIVFDQMDVRSHVGLQGDLYVFDVAADRQTRLTHGMRAGDPDVAPDARTLVFSAQRNDRRELMIATLTTSSPPSLIAPRPLVSAPDTEFASPRWSPDGRWIAAERREPGALPAIVVVEVASGSITTATSFPSSRCVGPAWTPDGRLLFSASRGDEPFRIFAVDIDTGAVQRLEGTGPSAQAPDVSPDGRTLVYVGYTSAGFDLFTLPLDSAEWSSPGADNGSPLADVVAPAAAADRVYTPWETMVPRFWTPIVGADNGETVVGGATASGDALGRHAYAASVQWARGRARPDWALSYVYDRWWPALFVSIDEDLDPYREGTARSTEVNAGVLLPWRRVRRTQSVLGTFHAGTERLQCHTCDPLPDERIARRGFRTGYAYSSARSFGYSISREEGWRLTATQEVIGRAFGSGGNARSLVADVRTYRRAGPRHGVLAGRLATAHSWGDEPMRRDFSSAGAGAASGDFPFDSDAIGLLRGFDDDFRGWHAAVVNLDYRFPLKRIQRGFGTLPAFVRSVHGAVFVDAGHAWTHSFRGREARVSFGVELSVDTVLGHALPVTLSSGAAWRRDGLDSQTGAALFGRIGRAF
jgi:hypothetical protein